MKLWQGRLKQTDKKVNDFNSSISFDSRLYKQDIKGSIAHAAMLGECGIIDKADANSIIEGLSAILSKLESGELPFDMQAEDIHTFVEQQLTFSIGDAGKKLHTARSRNDQVALDMRMYVKEQTDVVKNNTTELLKVISSLAKANIDTVMPGYTHLQRAQSVTFAHVLLAYAQMFRRDIGRLSDCAVRLDSMPLGSGALAGTTYPIDRGFVAEMLGFASVSENSMDSVADRDFCLEFLGALSILMSHLSRLSEDVILWCSKEFGFIELADEFSTGSSIMPQKKNPDVAELVRGKTGRVYGSLMALLTVMKGLPLAYNKDMQEDKQAVFDAADTVNMCLATFAPMLSTITVNKENMLRAAQQGFLNATDCADYLVKKGLAFRDAYKITGELVAYCLKNGKTLETLTLEEYKKASPVFEKGIYRAIDINTCVQQRKSAGGPAKDSITAQLQSLDKFISEVCK